LSPDGAVHRVIRIRQQATGVDHPEVAALPFGITEVPVTRGAGLVRNDGGATAENSVEESRLTDVGPANYGHGGFAHAATGICSTSVKS
jgi:hypothetical protein